MTASRSLPGPVDGRPQARRLWTLLVVVLLVAVPIAEVWLLVQVGQAIGVWPTVGLLVGEAVLGGWLLRREGTRAWRALTAATASGRLPGGEMADAALVLVGGVLLMLPGFVTDVVGLIFLLPPTRPLARRLLGLAVGRGLRRSGLSTPSFNPLGTLGARPPSAAGFDAGGNGVVIEGETVDPRAD